MSEGMQDREYRSQTVSIRKKVAGYVDLDGSSFSIRLTDEQAMDFAFSILHQAALTQPMPETTP